MAAVMNFFRNTYAVSPPTSLPPGTFAVGSYSFGITMCNFLLFCSSTNFAFTVVNRVIPNVVIQGQQSLTVSRSSGLTLSADAYVLQCNSTTRSRSNIGLYWTVSQAGIQNLTIISSSRQSNVFLLQPYYLNANTLYKISLQALYTTSYTSSFTSVQVSVSQSSLVAVIVGGSTRGLRLGTKTSLDGSASYDQDQNGVTGLEAGLSYLWTCMKIAPTINSFCSLRILGAANHTTLQVYAGSASINSTALIQVTIANNGRTAKSSVQLETLVTNAPVVTISCSINATKVNPSDKVSFVGTVTTNLAGTGTWTVSPGVVDLSSASLTPQQISIAASRSGPSTTNVALALQSNVLPMTSTLRFTLTVVTTMGASSSASITVLVNGPPLPGQFSVRTTALQIPKLTRESNFIFYLYVCFQHNFGLQLLSLGFTQSGLRAQSTIHFLDQPLE